jgi:hypothetical protein
LLRQFKPDGPPGLSLPNGRPIEGIAIRSNFLDLEADDIATSQLAVDSQIEHGKIPRSLVNQELGPDRPDVFLPQRGLCSNQLPFVPRYPLGGGKREIGIVLHGRTPLVADEDDLALRAGRL